MTYLTDSPHESSCVRSNLGDHSSYPITLQICDTFPYCLANSRTPAFVLVIFCWFVISLLFAIFYIIYFNKCYILY